MSESAGLVARTGISPRLLRFAELMQGPKGFNSFEHKWLAGVLQTDSGEAGSLQIAKDLNLQYGQIVALSGDLYGNPEYPISYPTDDKERRRRFNAAYDSLVNCDRKEIKAIIAVMAEEEKHITTRLKEDGVWPDQAYTEVDFDKKYDHATDSWHWYHAYNRYVELALTNIDHFGADAATAYKVGHAVAIDAAIAARASLSAGKKEESQQEFTTALAMNAFADHYLTDLFAAGHLRVPRRALYFQGDKTGYQGGAMAKSQHLEENTYGLFVSNALGQRWLCLGDAHLLTPAGRDNQAKAMAAVQASIAEIYDAFMTGTVRAAKDYKALQIAPDLAKAGKDEAADTIAEDKDCLNYVAQFIDRSASMPPGTALTEAIRVRDPLSEIGSRKTITLREANKNAGVSSTSTLGSEMFQNELEMRLKGETPKPFLPPRFVMARPSAPSFKAYAERKKLKTRGADQVRYAMCFLTTRSYPDGGPCTFLSDPSPWSGWIDCRPGNAIVITIPRWAGPDGHFVPERFVMIRQDGVNGKGTTLPEIEIGLVTVMIGEDSAFTDEKP